MHVILTDSLGVVALLAKVARLADAFPGVVAVAVHAVPVGDTFGAVGAGPALAAEAGVRHHTHALLSLF
jgi:hypothetical protein